MLQYRIYEPMGLARHRVNSRRRSTSCLDSSELKQCNAENSTQATSPQEQSLVTSIYTFDRKKLVEDQVQVATEIKLKIKSGSVT